MADQVEVNHAFVSAKPDSSDATIVSANEWNADLLFSGGADGQPLIKDSSKTTGAKFGQAPLAYRTSDTYSGASPSGAMASTAITTTDVANLMFFVNINATLASGNTVTVEIKRNGAVQRTRTARATGEYFCVAADVVAETAGTNTWTLVCSAGANFTALAVEFVAFLLPTV